MLHTIAILSPQGILQECTRLSGADGVTVSDIGKPLWEMAWWAGQNEAQAILREALARAAAGEVVRYRSELHAAGGIENVTLDVTLSPFRDGHDRVLRIFFEGRGASPSVEFAEPRNHELKETKRQLRDASAQLQAIWANRLFASQMDPAVGASVLLSAIVDGSDDAIISKDLNGTIMSWNKSAERLFGYTAAEAVGHSIRMLIPPERASEEAGILERLKRGERVDHFETVRMRKDGSRLNISLTISPVKDTEGRIFGASKIARDITDRVRQQKAIEEANAALERANGDLQQFAYSASHDLQEPLRMVLAFSELLSKTFSSELGPEGKNYVQHIAEGARRMDDLLRDLRAYTQASTTDSPPAGEIEAGDVLNKTLLNLEASIKESGAIIRSTALPRVPMHKFQLEQVFQNLIANAIRYRSDTHPCIQIAAQQRGREWLFSVQDNGIGIEPEFREQIFGLFKRLHSSSEYPGTGMGLAICQRVVERAGGRIWVESEVGHGSTFFFTVPMTEGFAQDAQDAVEKAAEPASTANCSQ